VHVLAWFATFTLHRLFQCAAVLQIRHDPGRPDAVLVPLLPRTVDVLALADVAALIEEAHGVRDGCWQWQSSTSPILACPPTTLTQHSPISRNWSG
jgi:hypothetical protein